MPKLKTCDSFFHVMNHKSAEQNVGGKHIFLTHDPVREQSAIHMTHIAMDHFYSTVFLSDVSVYNNSKQIFMGASDYIVAGYLDVRIFPQLTQCCFLLSELR